MVLQTDGYGLLMESPRGIRTRACQNTLFWPYPGQNTDIIQNVSQNIRP